MIEMTTLIPAFILAMLGNPNPAEVQTTIEPAHNVICWSSMERTVCFGYNDEGTHLSIPLNNQQ